MSGSSLRWSLEKIELMCFSTARSLRMSVAAIAALLLPWAISPRICFSRGVSHSIGELGTGRRVGDELLDDLGVDDRAAGRHRAHGGDEIVGVGDAVLEQIGAPVGTVLEQREGVARSGELAEHDDARRRMALAEAGGGPDAFVGTGRWHADVRDDDVRCELVDEGNQLVERSGDARHDEVVLGGEETGNRLADEVAVVGDDDAVDIGDGGYRRAQAAYSSTQSVATVASVVFTPPAANAAWAVERRLRAKSTVTVSASLGAPTAAAARRRAGLPVA